MAYPVVRMARLRSRWCRVRGLSVQGNGTYGVSAQGRSVGHRFFCEAVKDWQARRRAPVGAAVHAAPVWRLPVAKRAGEGQSRRLVGDGWKRALAPRK